MRYIDADALIKKIYPMGIGDGKYILNAKAVKLAIDNAPTADVVPKSEHETLKKLLDKTEDELYNARGDVERLQAELDDFKVRSNATCKACGQTTSKAIEDLQNKLFNAKADVAKIFAEIDKTLDKARRKYRDVLDHNGVIYTNYARAIIAELKKKYTESEADG